jgi:hypothetical protein
MVEYGTHSVCAGLSTFTIHMPTAPMIGAGQMASKATAFYREEDEERACWRFTRIGDRAGATQGTSR